MAPNPSAVAIKAAFEGNLRLLKKLASEMDLREAKDAKDQNALHLAAEKGHLEVCRFLVEGSGLDVNSTSADGQTPIFLAANEGEVSVLRYLLDHGGDPAIPDALGFTPLHMAAERARTGHDHSLKLLLEHGADPNRVCLGVYSPLLMACEACSLECVKLLVEAGADLNFIKPYGSSPLIDATKAGSTEIVKFLLDAGADPNICDNGAGSGPDLKIRGSEAFAKGDYAGAIYFYGLALLIRPFDATLLANRSLCWLRVADGKNALSDAQQCRVIRALWSKAWYREGSALRLLKNYKGAVDAFVEALKLDPTSDEIKAALRQCTSLIVSI
ncbi:hypothetical protein HU200_014984 [Digitaria exilis]|uniref:Uncharacterized protein n=1 Tax=Digitaria exilis TaxID=1010633 RepID=A0A835KME8_9POAL|nr:hypothetical protein HU200_014984 [Digitaria exilis]